MFLLPKGNPLYENIAVTKIKLPEMFEKLKGSTFTGYLHFTFPAAFSVFFFEDGKLISTMLEQDDKSQSGFEAIAGVCNLIFGEGGSLSVYKTSRDLTMCLHAMLHGDVLYKGQELKLIDIKGLLEKLKAQRLNGCLRIYTEDRTALIFYKEGAPLGFFHDGSTDIETSASESQKIAGLPGAKIDVLSTKSADELMHYDLLEMVNVAKLWESTASRFASEREKIRKEAQAVDKQQAESVLNELEDDLKEVAMAYVGKMGATLIEKELNDRGGRKALLDAASTTAFLAGVEKGAKLLTSISKTKEMLETMKNEIADRIKSL
ncbi:PATAN domain-containing protein [Geotalea uraniireducens]|uniref:PATAN domain-containing protein n=1 Tax=Geotalea uraniireducens TaxID=351604 RepID=A0ABM8EKZ8_9BACT|nr:GTPase-activating protein [Geotalea uraniireducens]BDV43111.1 PATAN domain-containing protein [Geotalea uraniireducens]